MKLRLCLLHAALNAACLAAPAVTKVEPPNWWVRHSWNQVQVLLTGTDLKGATVSTPTKGFRIEVRRTSENGHYLFAYVTIDPTVKPGKYRFQVKGASGSTEFELPLENLPDPKGKYQGFSSDDVIYLMMPDRFANGDPSNDSPAEL